MTRNRKSNRLVSLVLAMICFFGFASTSPSLAAGRLTLGPVEGQLSSSATTSLSKSKVNLSAGVNVDEIPGTASLKQPAKTSTESLLISGARNYSGLTDLRSGLATIAKRFALGESTETRLGRRASGDAGSAAAGVANMANSGADGLLVFRNTRAFDWVSRLRAQSEEFIPEPQELSNDAVGSMAFSLLPHDELEFHLHNEPKAGVDPDDRGITANSKSPSAGVALYSDLEKSQMTVISKSSGTSAFDHANSSAFKSTNSFFFFETNRFIAVSTNFSATKATKDLVAANTTEAPAPLQTATKSRAASASTATKMLLVNNNSLTISGNMIVGGSEDQLFTGDVLNSGGSNSLTVVNTGKTIFGGQAFVLSVKNTSGILTLNVAGTSGGVIISNVIQDFRTGKPTPDALIKNGAGTLTLAGTSANTFSQGLTLNDGTVLAAKTDALGDGDLLINNGTLNIGAFNQQTSGTLTMSGGTLTGTAGILTAASYDMQAGTVDAMLAGRGGLTKTTAGTLILTRSNSFTGTLNLQGGTLVLGHDRAAGSGTLALGNGVTIQGINGARTIANNLSFAGNVTFGGTEDLTFSDTFSLGGNRAFTVDNNTMFTGTISGSGNSLTKNGTGNLTLGGTAANTFSGGLTLNSGIITATKVNALGSGSLTVNAGTLNLGVNNQTVGAVTMTGGTINGTSGRLTGSSYQVQAGTINASLAGTAALTKTTAGTVTLSASNSYTGGTTINGGTLLVNNTTGSGTGTGAVVVNNGGTLAGTGTVLGQITLNSGSTIAAGAGTTGTFTSANQRWNSGATLRVGISDVDAGEGTGWSFLQINGALTISGSNPIFVDVRSLNLDGTAGLVHDFSNAASYTWRIATASAGITFSGGVSAATAFSIVQDNFYNNINGGRFAIEVDNNNNDVVLTFAPVPEPSAAAMLAIGFLIFFARAHFRRNARTAANK